MEDFEVCCIFCRQEFSSETELKDHNEKEHGNKNQSKFRCSSCRRNFRDSYNLRRHNSFLHSERMNEMMKKDIRPLRYTKCPICYEGFHKRHILGHFSSIHSIDIEEEDLVFPSFESFVSWKAHIEKETKSRYVKVRNEYTYKDGSTLNTFYCHRDGFVKDSRSKNIRRLKAFGSNKINGHCPSKIVMKCNSSGNVVVKYVKTHVGHAAELSRISLDKKEKEALAEKLSMNVPFDEILDDIRDSIKDSDLQRVHLLSKQDLRNIVRDFKVKKRSHTLPDTINFELGLERICVGESNFLRLYKPKGVIINEFPQLKAKDFLLLVMNDVQKEMLDKYGNNFLCIDVTPGIFLHDLDMYTLFVLDDSSKAFPCAFWFSNRSDVTALDLFFITLRDLMKKMIKTDILMTNDSLHDAWCQSIAPPQSHMYCSWHVDTDWRNGLKKIQDKEKQTVIYKQLRSVLEERDVNAFNKGIDKIFCDLSQDSETKEFAQHIEKYKTSSEKWAFCHRVQQQNMFIDLEKVHKFLKYIYLKRQKIHGIDDTICSIMSFLRGKYLDHAITGSFDKLLEIKERHRTAVNMTHANLTKISESSWDVSDSNNDEIFHVEQVKVDCDNCLVVCKPCSVCIHLYTCSCYDSSVKWNMCQHIHLVCIVANHEQNSCFTLETFEKPLKISEDEHSSGYESNGLTFPNNENDSEGPAIIQHMNEPMCSEEEQIEVKKKEVLTKFTMLLDHATSLEQLDLISKQLTPCEEVFGLMSCTKFEPNC